MKIVLVGQTLFSSTVFGSGISGMSSLPPSSLSQGLSDCNMTTKESQIMVWNVNALHLTDMS